MFWIDNYIMRSERDNLMKTTKFMPTFLAIVLILLWMTACSKNLHIEYPWPMVKMSDR